jgi:hypothetical protein
VKEIGIQGFNASQSCLHIFSLNSFYVRRQTSTAQKLPNAYEENTLTFQQKSGHWMTRPIQMAVIAVEKHTGNSRYGINFSHSFFILSWFYQPLNILL